MGRARWKAIAGRKGEAAVNPRQFYGGIALGIALSAAGWAVHHYAGPWAALRGPAAWTLLLAAVAVLAVTCVCMALGPGRPPRSPGAFPGPRVPESDEVRSYAARISDGPGLIRPGL
ncbi:hypothetical protein [Streptomyces sp. NBC_00354]|uniref:hypothetical protein n=1 Tax=Streptomyces sp. NBC_00354 TaxID=2975723 RepID=UPI002E27072A